MKLLNKEGRVRAVVLLPVAAILLGISYFFMQAERYFIILGFWFVAAVCLMACLKDPRDELRRRGSAVGPGAGATFMMTGLGNKGSDDGFGGGDGGDGGGGE